jgi:HSP20 family protein
MTHATLVRRQPTSTAVPVRPFFRGFESLFDDDFFRPFGAISSALKPSVEGQGAWIPAMDIRESKDAYTVTAELPGLTKKDVEITAEDNVLTISGERQLEAEGENENYHRIERSYGSFKRSFTLPIQVIQDKVDARYQNGILTISLPKAEEAKQRKIEIK